VDVAAEMRGAILGIFGGADDGIPADAVAALEAALTRAGTVHELITYPGAPHSFFDRKAAEFADAAADAWRHTLDLVRANTPG
jgi:carboxymethylenebutenolidase